MKNRNFIKIDNDKLKVIIDDFSSCRHCFNNYFGIDLCDVDCLVEEDNLFLLKKYTGFNRLYLIANDIPTIVDVLNIIPDNTVINIPSRSDITTWENLFEGTSIKPLAKYHRFNYTNYRKGNNKQIDFAKDDEASIISEQLNGFFSPLTGHLPTVDELVSMIKKRTILVNRNLNNEVVGALSCQIIGKKAELTFWYDYEGNGLSLLFNAFFACHEKDIRIITFWVNDDNANTIAIHEMLGAKRDGLVDYIYIKK